MSMLASTSEGLCVRGEWDAHLLLGDGRDSERVDEGQDQVAINVRLGGVQVFGGASVEYLHGRSAGSNGGMLSVRPPASR